jgi:recombination protein RecT
MATQLATTEEAPRQLAPADKVRNDLGKMADQLKMALPSHVSVDKFQRVTMTAIQTDPDLLAADRRSLFAAITRAAQDGLLSDKREGALVIFTNKVKGQNGERDQYIKAVQWMPMVAGILKKVRQSGEIAGISAHVVYEADDFVHRLGDDEAIEHNPPPLGSPRGKPIGAYAVATLKDGFKIREVMDIGQIERVRSVSKTGQYGPWKDWWDEMARKTVIRRLSKRLPMSTDVEAVINDPATEAAFAEGSAAVMASPQPLSAAALLGHGEPANDGTLLDENPTATEGRSDADHGDQFPGEDEQ